MSTSYTIEQRIRMRLDEFDVMENVALFPSKPKLEYKIRELIGKAKEDIRAYRHYPPTFTDEAIDQDIEKYYANLVIDLVLYDIATEGGEYQNMHSENGVNRSYVKKETILGKVIPFCNILLKED